MIRSTIIVVLMLFSAGAAFGQKYPERRDIRSGNKLYEKGGLHRGRSGLSARIREESRVV